jgi:transcriptional regulator with XRE-family HTH domain
MTLTEYIQSKGLTLDQFGLLIGRSGATVSRIARGIHKPDWQTMEAILSATAGEVDPNSFAGRSTDTTDDSTAFAGNKPRLAVVPTATEASGASNPTDTATELAGDPAPQRLVSGIAASGR